jgi:gamma-glutamylcyclotransferase (GGCT)/AIG2-like uncharacterized protein YtfP
VSARPSPHQPEFLFVYGTLRRGFDHPMARCLAQSAAYRGEASCAGRLYRVAHYPGLVLADDQAARVHGDLYALGQDAALLAAIDAYEGCGADDPPPHPYARQRTEVICADGAHCTAWTYVYRLSAAHLPLIPDGRFFGRP